MAKLVMSQFLALDGVMDAPQRFSLLLGRVTYEGASAWPGRKDDVMRLDLIDEYRLLVYRVVVGSGLRLFQEGTTPSLKLADSRAFSTGAVLLTYERA